MYSKLYGSIVMSSIWSESSDTCKVFLTLLALADKEGYVWGSSVGLSAISRVPIEGVDAALAILEGPDARSADLGRNPDGEGRRIEVVPGGWRLVNYTFYRDLERADDRRTKERLKKRRQRDCPEEEGTVPKSPPSDADADADTDAEEEAGEDGRPAAPPRVRGPKPKGTRKRPPVYLNPPTVAEVEEFVRARYPKANARDFTYRFMRKQTEVGWKDKQGRPIVSWKATVDHWMDYEEEKR